jgi:hypothetical protein
VSSLLAQVICLVYDVLNMCQICTRSHKKFKVYCHIEKRRQTTNKIFYYFAKNMSAHIFYNAIKSFVVTIGFETKVLMALKDAKKKGGKFSTFSKEEMPESWHYRNCARTPPILLCADVGYYFQEKGYNLSKYFIYCVALSTKLGFHLVPINSSSICSFYI